MQSDYGRPRPSHNAAVTEVEPEHTLGRAFPSLLALATSGRGIIMTRKMLKAAIDAMARDEDPAGVVRESGRDVVPTTAGNAMALAA
jgi:hypothetical protein